MTALSLRQRTTTTARSVLSLAAVGLSAAACASSSSMSSGAGAVSSASAMSSAAPTPDPRVGLRAGRWDAGVANWNLELLSTTRPSASFANPNEPDDPRFVNSDLAFSGRFAIQGNYAGVQIWDISDPRKPTLETAYVCPGSQSDVSVYKNLLFVSAEATSGRIDCGLQGVTDTVSHDRARGIRIYDISDLKHPRSLVMVQTCRGSHTNTLVVDPKDAENVYIYVSGSAPVRSPTELAGCSGGALDRDPNSALFRIEVIRVPLAHPEQAAIVSSPRIFNDLAPTMVHTDTANASLRAGPEVTQCHDITVYPAIGRAGGACRGYGLLLDVTDIAHPRRINQVSDPNMGAWHSATFNNDGTKVLFTDEWGGGSSPRCRSTDKLEWGADAIFTLSGSTMTFQSYFKMPAPQTPQENCVAHNGSLIPIPGRDIMVQGWYQGGIDVFEFTDPLHPREIAYYDRGPIDSTKLTLGGSWSAYWYNGVIVSSEIVRGLDIFALKPSALLSQNEIEAAKTVHLYYLNVQGQPKFVWPASFALARAYLDQLVRADGIARDRASGVSRQLDQAERAAGGDRQRQLLELATQLEADASGASDPGKVRAMVAAVRQLAGGMR
ncbi:MAG: hypothetical protein M3081_02455 [Gemmatimonadota bacterium]|nr:hypothetical protein [Gemmatimonadota bacterium]